MTKLEIITTDPFATGDTYALALHQLKDSKNPKLIVPTFKQSVEVLVELPDKLFKEYLSSWIDSKTGIAHKEHSTEFKIIPNSKDLANIPKDFNQQYISSNNTPSFNYNALDGIILDSKNGLYNQGLPKKEFLKHEAWNETLGSNLVTKFGNKVYGILGEDRKIMGFYILQNTNEDQLRSLVLWDLDSVCDADGRFDLSYNGRFLRVAQRGAEGANVQKNYSITQILKESERTNDFAPSQIKLLNNILEQNSYKIIRE
jgi:hypothetical protein